MGFPPGGAQKLSENRPCRGAENFFLDFSTTSGSCRGLATLANIVLGWLGLVTGHHVSA
jgi:hypothetical protein